MDCRDNDNKQLINSLSIKKISNLTNIINLNIEYSLCDDDTVETITKTFINLKKLNISYTKITNLSLGYLQSIQLEVLNIEGNDIDDNSLKFISEMQHIKKLILGEFMSDVTYSGLFMLSSLKNLIYLSIDKSILDDDLMFCEKNYSNFYNGCIIKNDNIKDLMKYCKYKIRISDIVKNKRIRYY